MPSEIASSSPSRPRTIRARCAHGQARHQISRYRPASSGQRSCSSGPPPGGEVECGGDPTGEPVGLADERAAAAGLCAELGPGHAVNLSAAGADILAAGSPRDPVGGPTPAVCTPEGLAMTVAYLVAGVRTPIGRYARRAGRRPPRRPGRARDPRAGRPAPVGGLGAGGRRRARLRQPGRRGQPQRGPDGGAAGRAARGGAGQHGQPALRLRPGRPRHRRPVHRGRGGRAGGRRRGGEHEPGAVRHAEGDVGVLPLGRGVRHHPGLAAGQPADARTGGGSTRCRRRRRTWPPSTASSRAEQDAFAYRSQQRAAKAQADGRFAEEIVPVSVPAGRRETRLVEVDEHPRETSLEKLAALPTPFRAGGTVTAGNSSGVNDGAVALLVASEAAVRPVRPDPAGPDQRRGGGRRAAPDHGDRPGAGHPQAARPASASSWARWTWWS